MFPIIERITERSLRLFSNDILCFGIFYYFYLLDCFRFLGLIHFLSHFYLLSFFHLINLINHFNLLRLIWLFFFFSKRTEADAAVTGRTDFRAILSILAHSPRWYLGVVAQVFYVGVQIAAWTWMNVYCQKELGVSPKEGATYYLIAIVAFIVCRWVATFAMKYVDPARLMALFAAAAVLCSFGVMYLPTRVLFTAGGLPFAGNILCLIAMSGFMSLMFPTIYGLALGGIDPRAHKIGAAGLIMAIVGGALLTPWMAAIIGDASSVWTRLVPMFASEWDTNLKLSQMSLRASFIVPAICFAVVFAYALAFRGRKVGK